MDDKKTLLEWSKFSNFKETRTSWCSQCRMIRKYRVNHLWSFEQLIMATSFFIIVGCLFIKFHWIANNMDIIKMLEQDKGLEQSLYKEFLLGISVAGYVSLLQIPNDRENKVRKLMNTNGLMSSAYILGIFTVDYVFLQIFNSLSTVILRFVFGITEITGRNIGSFLNELNSFGLSFIAYHYLISFLFPNTNSSVNKAGLFVALIGFQSFNY